MNTGMEKVKTEFENLFGMDPVIIRSPGRINLIGEHTDYNEGFVLPAAINRSIYLALKPRKDYICRIYAEDLQDKYEFDIRNFTKSEKAWVNYHLGVIDQLNRIGKKITGFDCVFGGNIPIGAGLSSSAAIEAGLAYGLNRLFELNIDKIDLVKLSQKAENEYVGVQCGIMDQFINIFGEENKALKLDCRTLNYEYYQFETKELKIVLCDTMVKHTLAGSEYNLRRKQCEEGAVKLREFNSSVKSLRDVTLDVLYTHEGDLDPVIFKRCEYVIRENNRVDSACNELNLNNLAAFGELMHQSHKGLRDKYEVSCDELDYLVDIASDTEGVLGSRMMGGGFGGCTINLIYADQVERFRNRIIENYTEKFGIEPKIHVCSITNGTGIAAE